MRKFKKILFRESDKSEQNKRRLETAGAVFKVFMAVVFLYFFIVSLGILSDGFQILGGASINKVLAEHQGTYY